MHTFPRVDDLDIVRTSAQFAEDALMRKLDCFTVQDSVKIGFAHRELDLFTVCNGENRLVPIGPDGNLKISVAKYNLLHLRGYDWLLL